MLLHKTEQSISWKYSKSSIVVVLLFFLLLLWSPYSSNIFVLLQILSKAEVLFHNFDPNSSSSAALLQNQVDWEKLIEKS